MSAPLAERMRPKMLDAYVGQEHLVGEKGALRQGLERKYLPSMILWGSPGIGKTTLALLLANALERPFFQLSAISSGVKDVRDTIEKAESQRFFNRPNPILFIDEIHRFNKSQQDALLGAVEKGTLTLIGATTENPSFEVISALLSRCQVYTLKPLDNQQLISLLNRAIVEDEILKQKQIRFEEYEAILRLSGGDGRKLYNILELVCAVAETDEIVINDEKITQVVQQNIAFYDAQPETGDNIYRIKAVYYDGLEKVSPIKTVVCTPLSKTAVFPNPADDFLNIDMSAYKNAPVSIYLYTTFGTLVQTEQVEKTGAQAAHIDISSLQSGNYLVRIVSKGQKDVVQTVVVMR